MSSIVFSFRRVTFCVSSISCDYQGGKEMSRSKEERAYEEHWEEEMKAQVISIQQEDQSISDWAARAAKLSLKKHIVLGKDGAITSST